MLERDVGTGGVSIRHKQITLSGDKRTAVFTAG